MLSMLLALAPACAAPVLAALRHEEAIDWFQGPYFSALAKAKAEGRLVFVVFTTSDSTWCDKLAVDSFSDAGVAAELADVVCVRVNATRDASNRHVEAGAAAIERRFAIKVFPSLYFVSAEGVTEDVIAGYIPPVPLLGEIRRVKQGQLTRSALEAFVAGNPGNIAARLELAQKLDDLGDTDGHAAQMAAVRELDPEGVSTPVRRLAYVAAREAMVAGFDDSKNHYPTEPLIEFLAKEQNADILWEGWSYLADLYRRLDRNKDSRDAHAKAWKHVPDAQILQYGFTLTQQFWTERDALKPSEERFALAVAERIAAKMTATPDLTASSRAALEDTIACCRYMNGERDEALAALDRAIGHDPGNPAYRQRRDVFGAR